MNVKASGVSWEMLHINVLNKLGNIRVKCRIYNQM